MASKIGTAVCGTARTVVWEVGKCENRRQMPFVISIYLLPDCRNATPMWGNATPSFKEKHYICTMKSIIESFAKEEQAILIVALFLLIYVGIMINVMVREYRTYLDDYPMCHFSLGDFIRRGRFYICLILGVVFITFVCLVVSLMAISIMAMRR